MHLTTLACALAAMALLGTACQTADDNEKPPPSAAIGTTNPTIREADAKPEAPPSLAAPRQLQFRPSDFADPNAKRILVLGVVTKAKKMLRPEKLEEQLFELLRSRTPSPYELRWRHNVRADEKVWGRVSVTYRKRLDRYKKRGKKKQRRGKLRFELTLQTRLPDEHLSNWDTLTHEAVYERPYEQLLDIEHELWTSLDTEIPALAVHRPDEARSFERLLDLRTDFGDGELHPVFRDPVSGVFRGGCAAIQKGETTEVYRLHDNMQPIFSIENAGHLTARCTDDGIYVAEAETDRAVKVWYEPWGATGGAPWENRANFDKPINVESLRFLASGGVICLVGERRDIGQRYAKLQCYNANHGDVVWEHNEPGTDIEALAIRKGVVALAAGRHLRLLDVATGAEIWSREVEGATGLTEHGADCLIDDLFVFSYGIGKYLAFNTATREAQWDLTTFGGGFLYCDTADGIYFDEVGGNLLSLSATDMSPRWRFKVANKILDARFYGGYLFVLLARSIHAINAKTGEVEWQMGVPANVESIYRHNRRLYLVGTNQLYELTDRGRR